MAQGRAQCLLGIAARFVMACPSAPAADNAMGHTPSLQIYDSSLLGISTYLSFKDRCIWVMSWRRVREVLKEHPPLSLRLCAVPVSTARGALACRLSCSPLSLLAVDLHGYAGVDISTLVRCLSEHSQQLRVLSLCHCRWLSGDALRHIPSSIVELGLWEAGNGEDPASEGGESDEEVDSREVEIHGLPRDGLEAFFARCSKLEVLDLRGQAFIDDELAIQGLGALPRLRKVALHGTSVTVAGGAALLSQRQDTLTRAGFGGLLAGRIGEEAPVPVLAGRALREVAMGFARNHVLFDFAKLPCAEVLDLDGLRPGLGLQRVVDWRDLTKTRVRQLMLNYSHLPADLFDILRPIAPQLTHFSVILSDLIGPQSRRAHPPAELLNSCMLLEHLGVSSPSCEELFAIARLPRLRILKVVNPLSDVLQSFPGSATGALFPALEELVLSGALSLPELQTIHGICNLIAVPRLTSLILDEMTILGAAGRSFWFPLLAALRSLREPNALRRLSFDDCSEVSELQDMTGFEEEVAAAVPSLESLYVPTRIFETIWFVEKIVKRLPRLRILGPHDVQAGARTFEGWLEVGRRRLRLYDPYGYDEACVKPAHSFLNLLRFHNLDPIFDVTEP